jgi:hypothetical protein
MKLPSKKLKILTDGFSSHANCLPPDNQQAITYLHECPVCGKGHLVNHILHALAYGRQLTCSCDCERRKRRERRCS